MQRVFDHHRIWRLDGGVFEHAAELIAAHTRQPDTVVGIARGGVALARRLGELHGAPVAEVTVRHNHSDAVYLPATGRVDLPDPSVLDGIDDGGHLLVVDDICGTGATLTAVLPWLVRYLKPSELRTAVLCRSEAAAFTPDVWVWNTRDWVIFPWDEPITQATQALPWPERVVTGPAPVRNGESS